MPETTRPAADYPPLSQDQAKTDKAARSEKTAMPETSTIMDLESHVRNLILRNGVPQGIPVGSQAGNHNMPPDAGWIAPHLRYLEKPSDGSNQAGNTSNLQTSPRKYRNRPSQAERKRGTRRIVALGPEASAGVVDPMPVQQRTREPADLPAKPGIAPHSDSPSLPYRSGNAANISDANLESSGPSHTGPSMSSNYRGGRSSHPRSFNQGRGAFHGRNDHNVPFQAPQSQYNSPHGERQQPWRGYPNPSSKAPHMQYAPSQLMAQPLIQHQRASYSNQPSNIYHRPTPSHRQLFHHQNNPPPVLFDPIAPIHEQIYYLERVSAGEVSKVKMSSMEFRDKEELRMKLEQACRDAVSALEQLHNVKFEPHSVELNCFGSLSSGFATHGSDMDLMLVSPQSKPDVATAESQIPRLIEKVFLDLGFGARLLTRTRVPIIRFCEKPTGELRDGLVQERIKWEEIRDAPVKPESKDKSKSGKSSKEKGGQEAGMSDGPKETSSKKAIPGTAVDSATPSATNNPTVKGEEFKEISLQEMISDLEGASAMLNAAIARNRELQETQLEETISDTGNDFASSIAATEQTVKDEGLKQKLPKEMSADTAVDSTAPSVATKPTVEGEDFKGISLQETISELEGVSAMLNAAINKKMKERSSEEMISDTAADSTSPIAVMNRTNLGSGDGDVNASSVTTRIQDLTDEHQKTSESGNEIIKSPDAEAPPARKQSLERPDEELTRLFGIAIHEGWYSPDERRIINRFVNLTQNRHVNQTELSDARAALQTLPDVLSRYRERTEPVSHLEFPKSGIGIQCDINFSNHLALYNTKLLRCYSKCDPRIRPMVLFVKAWAKQRKINSPYYGTLSSYGYVLMVLHYIVNIARPPLAPNLQIEDRSRPPFLIQLTDETTYDGHSIRFCQDEKALQLAASRNQITDNRESIGSLLRGFFEYFAHPVHSFNWSMDVLSLRTPGGILSKQSKGWTGARKTTVEPTTPDQTAREVKHHYLLAIEDPFETEHNVARPVVHHGIVAIRDEFRRANMLVHNAGYLHGVYTELCAEGKEHVMEKLFFGPNPALFRSRSKFIGPLNLAVEKRAGYQAPAGGKEGKGGGREREGQGEGEGQGQGQGKGEGGRREGKGKGKGGERGDDDDGGGGGERVGSCGSGASESVR